MSQPTNIIPIVSISSPVTAPHIIPSVDLDVTKQLLESKRPVIAEIELTLFENCNIECDFCFHDKQSLVGLSKDDMFSKLSIIETFMSQRQGTVELLQINIVGGELFQDRWMEELCSNYYDLVVEINILAAKYNHALRIVWVSNFLFGKKELVRGLVDDLRTIGVDNHLIVSYDFDGRPMSTRYQNNISWFGTEYIISVNLVGTTQSITAFMSDKDDYFKWLYATFTIYFDDFIPDKGSDDMVPSDSLLYSWYCFIADHYPKIAPVSDLITNESNTMHCLSLNKITIFPDNRTSNCRWHRYDQGDFNTKLDMHDNAGMMQTYIDELGCLSCEYYKRCGFRCFTQWDWKNRDADLTAPKCPMKAFFNYITADE